MPTPNKVAFEECYRDVEYLIYSMVNRFVKLYGLDPDDAMDAGILGFLKAAKGYKHGRGMKYSSWVGLKVKKQLLTLLRREIKRSKRFEYVEDMTQIPAKEPKSPWLKDFVAGLSDEAETVVMSFIDPPIPVLVDMLDWKGYESNGHWRNAVRRYLRVEKGWLTKEIGEAFQEVREAINE